MQTVRSYRGAISYAAKYAGKNSAFHDPETGEMLHVGRFWGVLGGENLPVMKMDFRITEKDFYRLRRVLNRVWSRVPRDGRQVGFAVYLDWQTWLRLLEEFTVNAWALSEQSLAFFQNPGRPPDEGKTKLRKVRGKWALKPELEPCWGWSPFCRIGVPSIDLVASCAGRSGTVMEF